MKHTDLAVLVKDLKQKVYEIEAHMSEKEEQRVFTIYSDRGELKATQSQFITYNGADAPKFVCHAAETLPNSISVTREQLAEVFKKHSFSLHKGGVFDSICKALGFEDLE